MNREELKPCGVEVGADDKAHFVDGNDCYIKQEADSVMDAMERDYEANRKLWEAEIASLKERVNELVDICEKNRVRRITDKERIKELEDENKSAVESYNNMVIIYNQMVDSFKRFNEDFVKAKQPPTTEECSSVEKE